MTNTVLFPDYPELLTTKEVGKILGVQKITLIRWAKSGKLVPEIRLNERGDKRYTKRQILAFLGQPIPETPLFADYPDLLTTKQVCAMLSVRKVTLIRWAKSGQLVPEIRLNERGDKRYTKPQIFAFLGLTYGM